VQVDEGRDHPQPSTSTPAPTLALALLSFWTSVTKHKINEGMSTETPQKPNMFPFWVHFKVGSNTIK